MATTKTSGNDAVTEFWARWNARDWVSLGGLVSPDFIHHDEHHDIGIEGYVEGSKGVCEQIADYVITVEQVVDDGAGQVAARWTGRGRHGRSFMGEEPSGRDLTVNGMDFFRLENGRIAENWQIIDMTGLRKQVEAIRDQQPQ